jgi:predicted Rossmann fold flavoprotein
MMAKRRVIVVGGGAAGLMAAGQAAINGAEVIVLEKKDRPGRKMRITGKGRCNLTNVAPLTEFISRFGKNGRFLHQAFARFFSEDLVAFLGEQGVDVATERGGRVFPISNDAGEVVDAILGWIKSCGVIIRNRSHVNGLIIENDRVFGVSLEGAPSIRGDAVIIATGGASYPATGSTGDGYRLAKSVGHTVVPIRPSLVPLETAGDTASRLQGLSLRNVSARIYINGKKKMGKFGEMLFTHFGLSGPIILSLSRQIVNALKENQKVEVSIDLKPALDNQKLDARLLRDLKEHGKQKFQTILKGLLPKKLIPVCIDLVEIPPDLVGHQITAQHRKQLRVWLKDFRLDVTGYRSFAEAIITAGGVTTKEINPRTMASRLIEGLYIVGEVIDIDGDTGGYNLQAAFSTGWLAGQAAAKSNS